MIQHQMDIPVQQENLNSQKKNNKNKELFFKPIFFGTIGSVTS